MLKKRNKFLAIGLATVGVIGAGSIAFATWIVGIQQKAVDLKLSLLVDNTQDKSFFLEATLDDSVIDVKDTVSITDPTKALVTTENVDQNALSFSLSTLRYKAGENFDGTISGFTFKLADGEADKLSVTTADGNNKIKDSTSTSELYRDNSQKLPYLVFNEVTVPSTELGDPTDSGGYKSYDVSKVNSKLKFIWGTFFKLKNEENGKSPAAFYNDIYCKKQSDSYDGLKDGLTNTFIAEQHTAIKEELASMKSTLEAIKELKIIVTANFN